MDKPKINDSLRLDWIEHNPGQIFVDRSSKEQRVSVDGGDNWFYRLREAIDHVLKED